MKYMVEYRCWAKVEVEAGSFDEALDKAGEKWYDAFADDKTGFKMMYGEPSYAEDESGESMEIY